MSSLYKEEEEEYGLQGELEEEEEAQRPANQQAITILVFVNIRLTPRASNELSDSTGDGI